MLIMRDTVYPFSSLEGMLVTVKIDLVLWKEYRSLSKANSFNISETPR